MKSFAFVAILAVLMGLCCHVFASTVTKKDTMLSDKEAEDVQRFADELGNVVRSKRSKTKSKRSKSDSKRGKSKRSKSKSKRSESKFDDDKYSGYFKYHDW